MGVIKIQEFRNEYSFLSNFYILSNPISFEGADYPTVEHFFQAMKSTNPKDWADFQITYNGPSDREYLTAGCAKRFGRNLPLRPSWERDKELFMKIGLEQKFTKNPDIAQKLLDTGNVQLIEGNRWNDRYWGVDLYSGLGQNRLGKLIMEVRAELRNATETPTEDTETSTADSQNLG